MHEEPSLVGALGRVGSDEYVYWKIPGKQQKFSQLTIDTTFWGGIYYTGRLQLSFPSQYNTHSNLVAHERKLVVLPEQLTKQST